MSDLAHAREIAERVLAAHAMRYCPHPIIQGIDADADKLARALLASEASRARWRELAREAKYVVECERSVAVASGWKADAETDADWLAKLAALEAEEVQ